MQFLLVLFVSQSGFGFNYAASAGYRAVDPEVNIHSLSLEFSDVRECLFRIVVLLELDAELLGDLVRDLGIFPILVQSQVNAKPLGSTDHVTVSAIGQVDSLEQLVRLAEENDGFL